MDSAQVTVTVPVTTSPALYALASVCTTTSHLGRDDDAASWLGAGIEISLAGAGAGAGASDPGASDAVGGVGSAAAGPSIGSAAVILRGRSVQVA